MPTVERRKAEQERNDLRLIGDAMKQRISRASMVPVVDGRFAQHVWTDREWPYCPTCNAPSVELPVPHARYGYLPTWFCPLCDFAGFARAVSDAAALAPRFASGELT